ncbi:g7236 [Coccomyxa viridis]|uniref:G7236 protein n=1 Tax=Coccomyxa viridis TaxID=1274662 RepID=A0ABP1G3Z8_9CHLO
MGSLNREGDASSCTRVTAVKEEGTPRSDASEPPSPKCKRRPRRKTEMWRMNNQLAQKRFRQKQKARSPPTAFGSDKQKAQQEHVYELSEQVAELEERQRGLEKALDACRQDAQAEQQSGGAVLELDLLQIHLTQQELDCMDRQTLSVIWKGVAEKLGACVAKAEHCSVNELLQHLQALGLEVLQLLQCLLEHNPGLVSALQGPSSEGLKGSLASLASNQGFRPGALGCLKLSQDFRKVLEKARDIILLSHDKLLPQRVVLTSQMQGAPVQADICRQARILRQLHASADAAFVHQLILELLAHV